MKAKISLCIVICLNAILLSANTDWLDDSNPTLQSSVQILETTQDNEQPTSTSIQPTPVPIDNTSVRKSGFCKGGHINEGCFIGLLLHFGIAQNIPTINTDTTSYTLPTPTLEFGYQWFNDTQGLRLSGYVGYLYYGLHYATYKPLNHTATYIKDINVHILQYGLKTSFLYDIYHMGSTRLGLDFGSGLEALTYLPNRVTTKSYQGIAYNGDNNSYTFMGRHYGNLDITSNGIFLDNQNINSMLGVNTRERSHKILTNTQLIGTLHIGLTLSTKAHHQFSLAYIYRHYVDKKAFGIEHIATIYIYQPHLIALGYSYIF